MLKLYHSAQSRSTRPRWLLEELGEPYELVRIDLGKQEHKTSQYLQIHQALPDRNKLKCRRKYQNIFFFPIGPGFLQ